MALTMVASALDIHCAIKGSVVISAPYPQIQYTIASHVGPLYLTISNQRASTSTVILNRESPMVLIITNSDIPTELTVLTAITNGSITLIGQLLFTEYVLPFEIISILLLVAVIGAVVIAKRRFN